MHQSSFQYTSARIAMSDYLDDSEHPIKFEPYSSEQGYVIRLDFDWLLTVIQIIAHWKSVTLSRVSATANTHQQVQEIIYIGSSYGQYISEQFYLLTYNYHYNLVQNDFCM
jgi:hypothetical protein